MSLEDSRSINQNTDLDLISSESQPTAYSSDPYEQLNYTIQAQNSQDNSTTQVKMVPQDTSAAVSLSSI